MERLTGEEKASTRLVLKTAVGAGWYHLYVLKLRPLFVVDDRLGSRQLSVVHRELLSLL